MKFTYSELRFKLYEIIKPMFLNDAFVRIYEKNSQKYSNQELAFMLISEKEKTTDFLEKLYKTKENSHKVSTLCRHTDAKLICCLYYRYWIVINLLAAGSGNPNNSFSFKKDATNLDILKTLLIGWADGTNTII